MNEQHDRSPLDPPSVRIIRGVARKIAGNTRSVVFGILLVVIVTWIVGGIYTVENRETANVLRFGKLVKTGVSPGLHFRLPSGIETVHSFTTGEVFRLELESRAGGEISLISGDENLIATSLVVQYRVTDLGRYLYDTADPEGLVAHVVRTALLSTVSRMQVDDLLTTGKAQIQNEVRTEAQETLRRYGCGITLVAVTLRSVAPPTEAASAFRKVQDSRSEAARTINDSETLREHALSLARGTAAQMISEASVDAQSRVQRARGAAERFQSLLAQYRELPDQTRDELFRRTMTEVLPRAETVILAPGESPRIDIHLRGRVQP